MDTKLFKAFTPYKHGVDLDISMQEFNEMEAALKERLVTDPGATQWRSIGFTEVLDGELLVDLQGGGYLACVLVNDRVLPGAVIREGMAKMIASIEQRDGRKPSKKQYAEIKDEVILELLPKAFIRRKHIPVYFSGDNLIVFTASAKMADDVMHVIQRTLPQFDKTGTGAYPLISRVAHDPTGLFKTLANDGANDPIDGVLLHSSDAIVLKRGKKTIRVKDVAIEEGHIQKLMEQEYEIVSMAIELHDEYGEVATAKFILNEHLVFSGFTLPNQGSRSNGREEGDFVGAAWLITSSIKATINHVVGELGLKEIDDTPGSSDGDDGL